MSQEASTCAEQQMRNEYLKLRLEKNEGVWRSVEVRKSDSMDEKYTLPFAIDSAMAKM